ncbi:BrnT family toxin [Longimicrobium sp.]|uniref:BrnT family toxin n=1 Tax=Longimicrobium sp. TaxID=2029185 RepID=UPI0032C20F95
MEDAGAHPARRVAAARPGRKLTRTYPSRRRVNTSRFHDPLCATVEDERHSGEETRYVLFGRSARDRLLAVMHTDRGKTIRIISARRMTGRESREYANDWSES